MHLNQKVLKSFLEIQRKSLNTQPIFFVYLNLFRCNIFSLEHLKEDLNCRFEIQITQTLEKKQHVQLVVTRGNKYRRKQKYSVNVPVQNQKIGIPVTSRRDVINSLTETTMADDSSKLKEQIAYLTSK